MAFRKHVLVSVVLLAISGILFGCGDSTVAPLTNDEAPIVAPANVTAETMSNGNIVISWDASSQANLRGYNVYRLDNGNSQIEKLNASEIALTSYVDGNALKHVEYQYRVTAVSSKGTESGFNAVLVSNETSDGNLKDRPQTD